MNFHATARHITWRSKSTKERSVFASWTMTILCKNFYVNILLYFILNLYKKFQFDNTEINDARSLIAKWEKKNRRIWVLDAKIEFERDVSRHTWDFKTEKNYVRKNLFLKTCVGWTATSGMYSNFRFRGPRNIAARSFLPVRVLAVGSNAFLIISIHVTNLTSLLYRTNAFELFSIATRGSTSSNFIIHPIVSSQFSIRVEVIALSRAVRKKNDRLSRDRSIILNV